MPFHAPRTTRATAAARILTTFLLGACASASFAADDADLAPRAMLRSAASTEKEAGIALAVGPNYLGSSQHQGYLGVAVEDNFGNGWFVSGADGVGYRFLETPSGFSMAASIGASPMRRERDGTEDNAALGAKGNRLRGMGDVGAKFQGNVFLNYDSGPFHAGAELHQTLAARRGTGVDLTAAYDLVAKHDDLVRLSADVSYANRSLMQTFFGVTPRQSALSGNAVYTPRAGIAGGGIDLFWRHAFTSRWTGTLGAGVIHLRGPAAGSPVTEKRTSAVIGGGIAYRF
jgi:outer membrane protein